jgi:hypothetical protein
MHAPLALQLAHRCIDHGVAGTALAPGIEAAPRARPAIAAGAVVAPRQGWVGGEHLVVEVAPAELARVGAAALARECLAQQLQRRDAAEAQVGAQPGGLVAGEVIVVGGVAGETVAQEGSHRLAPFRLAAARPLRRWQPSAKQRIERWQAADREPRWHR